MSQLGRAARSGRDPHPHNSVLIPPFLRSNSCTRAPKDPRLYYFVAAVASTVTASNGGQGRIRTSEGYCQQIYSLPPLTAREPGHSRETSLSISEAGGYENVRGSRATSGPHTAGRGDPQTRRTATPYSPREVPPRGPPPHKCYELFSIAYILTSCLYLCISALASQLGWGRPHAAPLWS